MPIQNINWIAGMHREIHVVANNSSTDISNSHLAFVTVKNGVPVPVRASSYLADSSNWSDASKPETVDVSLTFTPLFKGAFGTGASAALYSGSGITVNTHTGKITVGATLPAKRKSNFIMEVTAYNKPGPTPAFSIIIRVHIHQAITKIWLTPAVLSVRPFTTDNTFALRAQFDDNTVGDITQMPGVIWTPSSNVGTINGKLQIAAGNQPGNTVDITAQLSVNLGNQHATAKIKIEKPWDSSNPVDISIVAGGGSASIAKPVNVLFISEGFISADQAEFTKMVTGLVRFSNDPINLPWSKLLSSINFWSAFIPATERGFSIGSEMYTAVKNSGSTPITIADFLPIPVKPATGATTIWDISGLLYAVGLPVQSDGVLLPGGSPNPRTNQDIINDWKAVLTTDPTPNVNTALIDSWRVLATRTMIDEINSTFGVIAGQPIPENTARIMEFKDGRMSRDVLDHLLGSLNNPVTGGVPVNNIWNKTGTTLPNDYDLICFLTYGYGRESNQEGYYFVNTNANYPTVNAVAGTNAYSLTLPPAAASFIIANKSRTFVHELAHSFFIDDEYAELLGPGVLTSADLNIFSNTMLAADVLTNAQIDVAKIKWNWHRIKNGAVLSAAITVPAPANPNTFLLTVVAGQGTAFKTGDTVHLRFRKYPSALPAYPKLSVPLEIVDPAPTATAINVKVKTGGSFVYPNLVNPADFITTFLPDSIVYTPVDAAASVKTATYPYAEIIAKNVKDYMSTAHLPLTGRPPATPVLDKTNPQPPVFPASFSFPASFQSVNQPRIAGLYAGGHTFQLGVYHATGNCIMRKSQDPPVNDILGREFCAICRYILVDTINPNAHGDIDALYASSYPQT